MSKEKKPSERMAAVPKDVKDALQTLEKGVGDTLKELEKLKPAKEAARSADEARSVLESRINKLRSLIDKYVADQHITGDFKSEFKRLRDQLPQLTAKLQESIEKGAASIYADRVKVYADDLKLSLKRLRQKIRY